MKEDSPKKSLGQHWLSDITALNAMCEAADINPEDTVLEIGPGQGTLTRQLLKRAGHVVAVEFDKILAVNLPEKVGNKDKLSVVTEDILRFDLTQLPPNYKVVANIPYYLTSHLLRLLSESTNPPAIAALLVQKEVAERVTASAGGMSILSVITQFNWNVSTGIIVPARLFTPPPKIDSQILILEWRKRQLFPDVKTKQFFRLVKAGFSNRRKTLENSLAGGLRIKKEIVRSLLQSANVTPTARAQELTLRQWHQIYCTVMDSNSGILEA